MMLKKMLLTFLLSGLFATLNAQGFQAPAKGKAVVYFARISNYGSAVAFDFFHQDTYIGSFKGKNYMRYECDPGENLFWASSENKEFLTAELEANQSYLVIVDVIIGAWQAHVGFTPISIDDTEKFEKAKKLILAKPASIISPSKMEKTSKKLVKFIPEKLKMYEDKWKDEKNFRHLSADMAIPLEYLK